MIKSWPMPMILFTAVRLGDYCPNRKDIIDGEVHYLVQWKPTLCQSTRSTLPNWLASLRLNMGNHMQRIDPYGKVRL